MNVYPPLLKTFHVFTIILLIFTFVFALSPQPLRADIVDIIRYDRPVHSEVQSGQPFYDPAKSNGIVSPFTNYIGKITQKLEEGASLKDAAGVEFPKLKANEIRINYVDPAKIVELTNLEDVRNYVGLRIFFTIEAPIESVFNLLTDYNDIWKINDGMIESDIIKQNKNLTVVANKREVSIQFIGSRQKYYKTSNIESMKNDSVRKIIRTQLMDSSKEEKELGIDSTSYYADSVWFLESAGENLTRVFTTSFTLIKWDYEKMPLVFPFVRQTVRRGLVDGSLNGSYKIARAFIVKLTDPRWKDKSLKDFTAQDEALLSKEVDSWLNKEKNSAIHMNWKDAFHGKGALNNSK